jgi:hypothetical protein
MLKPQWFEKKAYIIRHLMKCMQHNTKNEAWCTIWTLDDRNVSRGFTNRSKCNTLLGNARNGGAIHLAVQGIWKISVAFPLVCREPKTPLKMKEKKKAG